MFTEEEANTRLESIVSLIDRQLAKDCGASITLLKIKALASGREEELEQNKLLEIDNSGQSIITISCDASVKENPGGPASVGVVIQQPKQRQLSIAQDSRAKTNNQAEYDAIYFGLTTLVNLSNSPRYPVEIHSDSQLVIKQLNGTNECNEEKLQRKRDLIRELVSTIPTKISFVWKPRNSTPELKLANNLAQQFLGIPLH